MSKGKIFILMGVSGSGKSSVGAEIAKQLGLKFIDGDDLHPRANIIKMASGQPLDDQDRLPWLTRINDTAFSLESKNEQAIIVCSALKKAYRDHIRKGNQHIYFLFLHSHFEVILARMQQRKGHFMKAEMLQSQFETLEMPQTDENDITLIDIAKPFEDVVQDCIFVIKQRNAHNS